MYPWFATVFQRRSCHNSLVSQKVAHWTLHHFTSSGSVFPFAKCFKSSCALLCFAASDSGYFAVKVRWAKPTALPSPVAWSECRQPGLTARHSHLEKQGLWVLCFLVPFWVQDFCLVPFFEDFFIPRSCLMFFVKECKNGCVFWYLKTCVQRLGINWRHFRLHIIELISGQFWPVWPLNHACAQWRLLVCGLHRPSSGIFYCAVMFHVAFCRIKLFKFHIFIHFPFWQIWFDDFMVLVCLSDR